MNKTLFTLLLVSFLVAQVLSAQTVINLYANGGAGKPGKHCDKDKLPGSYDKPSSKNKHPLAVVNVSPFSHTLNTLISRELHIKPDVVPFTSFGAVVDLVKSCAIDYAVVGMSITDARKNDGVLFSVPYARERLFLIKKKTSALAGNQITIITLGSSTLDTLADGVISNPEGALAGKTIVKDAILGGTPDIIDRLRAAGDDTVAVYSNGDPLPDDFEEITAGDFTSFGTDIAVAFCRHNTDMQQKVDDFLNNKFNPVVFRGKSVADLFAAGGYEF